MQAQVSLDQIDVIAVTNRPGLVGSLLVGTCFAKGLAWVLNKKIIAVDHLEGHIFSVFLQKDYSVNTSIQFPFIALSASGGHTALHLVTDFGKYELIGQTLDDAAGEAFDKVAKTIGLGYPGGAAIERLAAVAEFKDFFKYPRTKGAKDSVTFSFSGLKTAVLYDLVKRGAYDLATGPIFDHITPALQQQVSSSFLVCVGDILVQTMRRALNKYPQATGIAFTGGVACNNYLRSRLVDLCNQCKKQFFVAPPHFCTDNGAMIAFVGAIKAAQGKFSDISFDVMKE